MSSSEESPLLYPNFSSNNKNNNIVGIENASSSVEQDNGRRYDGEEGLSNSTATEEQEEDELARPWPATFERSISLLASPRIQPSLVEMATKSPKIQPSSFQVLRYRRDYDNDHLPEGQRITKMKSLDFAPSSSIQTKQIDPKLYRQQLLQKVASSSQQPLKKIATSDVEKQHQTPPPKESHDHHGSASMEKASYGQCAFNMANILMGVGMLGLPFIFSRAGWFGGLFATFSFGIIAWRTSILIGRELNGDPRPCTYFDHGLSYDYSSTKNNKNNSKKTCIRLRKQLKSFPDVAREAFGQKGNIILSSTLYFELFSCLCIFFVTLGDHLHTIIPNVSSEKHMIICSFLLSIPTALLSTPRLLSYLSAVGTFATISIVLSVLASAVYFGDISESVAISEGITSSISASTEPTNYHTLWRTSGLPIAFGLIAFTFSGHAIVPSIYSSMKDPQEFESMITVTFSVVMLSCLTVAVSGYYMFGSTVDDQITLSLQKAVEATSSTNTGSLIDILTWLMICTAFSKFTLTAFPLALGIEEIFAPCVPSDRVMNLVSSLIKLVLIGLALLVALYIPSFSKLCSLVGLICTMVVSVIFPAAAHLRLFGNALTFWEKIFDYFLVVSGTGLAVFGTLFTVQG